MLKLNQHWCIASLKIQSLESRSLDTDRLRSLSKMITSLHLSHLTSSFLVLCLGKGEGEDRGSVAFSVEVLDR